MEEEKIEAPIEESTEATRETTDTGSEVEAETSEASVEEVAE